MIALIQIVLEAIAGIAGGALAGQLVMTRSMALLARVLSGAVGGIAGGSLVGWLVDGATEAVAGPQGGHGVFEYLCELAGAGLGGGFLTAIAAQYLGRR